MQPEISSIVSRAATLWERLARAGEDQRPALTGVERERASDLLQIWQKTAARGDDELFARRLRWAGWEREQVLQALVADDAKDCPAWAATLAAIVTADCATHPATNVPDRVRISDQPVPFEELLLGAVRVARQRTGLDGSKRCAPLAASLERALLMRLATLAFPAFFHEFDLHRPQGVVLLANMLGDSAQPAAGHYARFVASHGANGALDLFCKYPVLARLCAQAVDFWVESVCEFRDRLEMDWDLLGLGEEAVASVDAGLSDFHHRHRSVFVLQWASGRQLVYKPHGLAADTAYAALLQWLNDRGVRPPLWAPRSWDRGAYGWMAFVAHRPCASDDELHRYYERAGMLVCLSRVLQSCDLHRENLIACGEHPVLIDLETLMHPDPEQKALLGDVALSGAEMRAFSRSVRRSGLLPLWMEDAYGQGLEDVSGLGGMAGTGARAVRTIAAINTDAMRVVTEHESAASAPNQPFADGNGDPARYLPSIEAGFTRLYALLVRERETLLAPDGPLGAMRSLPLRFVFRSTSLYAAILERSTRLACLGDGARRSIELDAVSRALLHAAETPDLWPLVAAELIALERMDVPVFMAGAGSTVLTSADMAPLSGCLESPAFSRVLATVRDLSDADLAFQLRILRGLFHTCRSAAHVAAVPAPTARKVEPVTPVSADTAWREATAIADSLLASMLVTPETGAACWLGLQNDTRGERHFRPTGDALFDGRPGIALFLAAMASAGAGGRYRDAALQAIEPILALARAQSGHCRAQLLRSTGIGGLTGIGATVYSLVRIGEFLVEPEFMEHATWFAEALTPASIARDRQLDIVNGTAGALLALLRLFDLTSAPELLSRAVLCGEHLLGSSLPTAHGHRAWPSSAGATPLTGFSHGASGIGHALLALFARTRRPEFRDAALEGFAYERSLFDPAAGNWRDLRGGNAPYMAGWCHGAPGIGMARVAALEVCAHELLADDLARAVDGTLRVARAPVDHYCCGEFGRITFLGEAKQETAARSRAGRLLADQRLSGHFRLFTDVPEAENPGFFQGLAGIGYGWLRLADKAEFPNVLMLA